MRKIIIQYTEEEHAAFVRKHEAEWKSVGAKIQFIRTQLRISQKRLAKAVGICVNTLRKLERGQYITRFKTISRSCVNWLRAVACNDFLRVTQTMGVGQD